MPRYTYLLLATLFSFIMVSCDPEEPEPPNEEEVITTLIYSLSPMGGGDTVTLSFRDIDGDGGEEPTITGGTLSANTTYTGSLTLRNESESPAEEITTEIEEEAEEHQFFFQSTVAGLQVAYNDVDADNNPVGLATTLTTDNDGSGTITITLRHEPNKSADGVSNGDISNAGGEADIEVSIPISVQ